MNINDKAGEAMSHANDKFDEARNGVAEVLDHAASSVRSTGHQGAKAINDLSQHSSGKLNAGAAYMRDHDAGDLLQQAQLWLSKHPTQFAIMAASVGFLVGSALQKKSDG